MSAPGVGDVLATPLQFLKGVGPRRAADFEHAGLLTLEDLLYRFPLRYEDRSRLQPISSLAPGQVASLTGRILACGLRSTRRPGFKIFEAAIDDGTGSLRAVWMNQPYLRDIFARGQHVIFYGAVEMRGSASLQLTNPQYEILDDEEGEPGSDLTALLREELPRGTVEVGFLERQTNRENRFRLLPPDQTRAALAEYY